jgi:5-methyltetrahydrofolate--homocysteine methyltransferase
MIPFAEALKSGKILILDGATGTQLVARGGITGALSNFECPEIVKAVHADYKAAGADIVLANTLTANRIALEHAGLADRIVDINELGAQLCREAVGDDCYVCGDMGSTGKFMEPLGEYTEEQFYDNAAEQAEILTDGGVDLIIIETMTDVRETVIAVRAAKDASGLPVIASISFDPVGDGFRTMMGDTAERAVLMLAEAGADAVGSNCGTLDPWEMSRMIAKMRTYSDIILIAMPNAGKPELSAGEVTFKLTPEEFADGAMKCVEAAATLVGGCCGTTPAHIAALAKRVKSL